MGLTPKSGSPEDTDLERFGPRAISERLIGFPGLAGLELGGPVVHWAHRRAPEGRVPQPELVESAIDDDADDDGRIE